MTLSSVSFFIPSLIWMLATVIITVVNKTIVQENMTFIFVPSLNDFNKPSPPSFFKYVYNYSYEALLDK